jgi:hypothetical protein
MKVPVSPRLSVAEAERMARGMGCALVVEDGRPFLALRERPPAPRPHGQEARHG